MYSIKFIPLLFILIEGVISANKTVINPFSLKIIPGLDLLGWGIDLRLSTDPELGIKVPFYAFNEYGNSDDMLLGVNVWTYPLQPKVMYRYPDNVGVRNVAYTETETYVLKSEQNKTSLLKLDVGIQGQYQTAGSLFDGDIELGYQKTSLSTNEFYVIANRIYYGIFQLVAGEPSINAIVQEAMNSLELLINNEAELLSFIDRFGTHYIDSVLVGGSLSLETIVNRSISTSEDHLGVFATISFNNMFGIDKGNASLDLNFNKDYISFQQSTTTTLSTKGGSYSLANFFSGSHFNPYETLEEWVGNLIHNAVPIKIRCKEISWLFPDEKLRIAMRSAIQDYLNGTTAISVLEQQFNPGFS